jgi:hypothetical protein
VKPLRQSSDYHYYPVATSARVVNRVVLHRACHNRVPGCARTHASGRMVHTFLLSIDPGGLHVITERYSVRVRYYAPGLGPSYVGANPLRDRLHAVPRANRVCHYTGSVSDDNGVTWEQVYGN